MPAATRQRPDCLIIGAAKAGTTTLFNVLAAHPEVAPSREKETRFYSHDERYANGPDWYGSEFFAGSAPGAVRMEATPAYLTWSEKVAPRIRQAYPDDGVSLVVILRDPVSRAYSHYCHRVRLGHETLSFADAIDREESLLRVHWDELSRTGNGKHGYLRASCYASRLRPFIDHFDRRRILFLLQDDLQADRFGHAMARLLAFMQVDYSVALKPARLNTPTRARHASLARAYWRLKRTAARTIYTTVVPNAVRRRVLPLLFPAAAYPPLDPVLAQELRLRLADEVRATQDLIGRDLTGWLPA